MPQCERMVNGRWGKVAPAGSFGAQLRQAPVLTIHFRHGDTSPRLFATSIECLFPVDDPTARMFQDWAAGRSPS